MLPEPHETVLIARLAVPLDAERACRQHWYRLPAAGAPAALSAPWLALYQGAAFGAERFQLRVYAAIERLEVLRRRELLPAEPTHPRADQPYYVLRLGPCQPFDPPIQVRRRHRFSFIITTFGALLAGADLSGLHRPAAPVPDVWGAGLAGRVVRRTDSAAAQTAAPDAQRKVDEIVNVALRTDGDASGEGQADQR